MFTDKKTYKRPKNFAKRGFYSLLLLSLLGMGAIQASQKPIACFLDNDSFLLDHHKDVDKKLPKRFRTFKNAFGYSFSGSAQFSKTQLKNILNNLKKEVNVDASQIYIVDLRQEPHLFLNEDSVTVYSPHFEKFWGYSLDQSLRCEKSLYDRLILLKNQEISLKKVASKTKETGWNIKDTKRIVQSTQCENEAVRVFGASYQRFSVTDHRPPTPQIVDDYLRFLESLPKGAHLHFHCRGGAGRTSTFMLIYDLFCYKKQNKHDPKVYMPDLEKIACQHQSKGSIPLLKEPNHPNAYRKEEALKRSTFIHDFYNYLSDPKGYGSQTFTQWIAMGSNAPVK